MSARLAVEGSRSPTSVSVIVPVFNEVSTIDALQDQFDRIDFAGNLCEVIFVDGGSTDGTRDRVRAPYRLIDQEGCGRGGALNTGGANGCGRGAFLSPLRQRASRGGLSRNRRGFIAHARRDVRYPLQRADPGAHAVPGDVEPAGEVPPYLVWRSGVSLSRGTYSLRRDVSRCAAYGGFSIRLEPEAPRRAAWYDKASHPHVGAAFSRWGGQSPAGVGKHGAPPLALCEGASPEELALAYGNVR